MFGKEILHISCPLWRGNIIDLDRHDHFPSGVILVSEDEPEIGLALDSYCPLVVGMFLQRWLDGGENGG